MPDCFAKQKLELRLSFNEKNQGFLKAQDSKSLKEPRPNITLSFLNQGSGCVAQLVEQSLPILEVHDLNPVIGKNLFILNICLLSPVYWKDENKEKEAGNGPFKKKSFLNHNSFLTLFEFQLRFHGQH